MKKIISSLLLAIFCITGASLFAQTSKTALAGNSEDLKTNIANNTLQFKIPTVTQNEIDRCAKYYTNTFSVKLLNKDDVRINLIENDPKSNRIILRFLSALNVQLINVSDKEFTLSEFYDAFLK